MAQTDTAHKLPGKPLSRRTIKEKIEAYPQLEKKIYLQLLLTLHERQFISIEDINAKVRKNVKSAYQTLAWENPNVSPEQWSASEWRDIRKQALEVASQYLSETEVDDLLYSAVKREYIYSLENITNLSEVAFGVLADKVREYCRIPAVVKLPVEEVIGLRVSLLKQFVSNQLDFIKVAKKYLTVQDLPQIVDNTIGSSSGHGHIGGKAAGMLLGYKIVMTELGDKYGDRIRIPESYYLRTDVSEDFLRLNGLARFQSQKYKSTDQIRDEYPVIQEIFQNAQFPDYLVEQCRALLKKIGKHPLIVRSSSLLEDNFKAAFSGKYQSVFLGNQGPLEHRLSNLLAAIGEVFASGLAPDPLIYRKEHDLLDYDERVGILIQKVVGVKYHRYFMPAFAGVALSHNEYTWSPRIKPEDGLMRIVMGLGTRAVDRVGDDYPRLVGLSAPTLRPAATVAAQRKYSQTHIDLINLETNSYEIIPLSQFWGPHRLKGFEDIFSLEDDGCLLPPYSAVAPEKYPQGVVTFQRLLKDTPFPQMIRDILKTLAQAYGCPVAIEFSHDTEYLYLLQTKPLARLFEEEAAEIPEDIPVKNQVFSARRHVRSGAIDNIDYIIYCNPRAYHGIADNHTRIQLARTVGKLNQALAEKTFILMGPGRWGTNTVGLGIPVQYSEINHTRALIEIAYREGDYTPEVSFGTHFFLDLVEKGIHYLPLFPDEGDASFNDEFFHKAPNDLSDILPKAGNFASYLKVINVARAGGGQPLHLRMNGPENYALAYFANRG